MPRVFGFRPELLRLSREKLLHPCNARAPGESNHLREDSNLAATFRDRGQNSLIWKESLYPGVSGHGRETERSRPAGRKVSCSTPCSLAHSGPTHRLQQLPQSRAGSDQGTTFGVAEPSCGSAIWLQQVAAKTVENVPFAASGTIRMMS